MQSHFLWYGHFLQNTHKPVSFHWLRPCSTSARKRTTHIPYLKHNIPLMLCWNLTNYYQKYFCLIEPLFHIVKLNTLWFSIVSWVKWFTTSYNSPNDEFTIQYPQEFSLFWPMQTICSPVTFYFGNCSSKWAKAYIFIWLRVNAESTTCIPSV